MSALTPLVLIGLALTTAVASTSDSIERCLKEPILDPKDAREELNRFIRERIPELVLPSSASEWEVQSEELRQQVLDEIIFRGAPEEWRNWKAKAVWGDTMETGKEYRIKKLRYEALPGLWISALLYEPDLPQEGGVAEKTPAVLNVNGHVGPPGKGIDYEQIRCINLAKRGILALHPEWLFFGELQGEDYAHNRLSYLDLCGVSGVSVFYLAMRGGLDVLVDHPSTDPERVAMTGLSGGGWQTIILSSLDTRIRLAVPNAGYIGLTPRTEHPGDIGDLEQNPTDLVSIADYTHLTALLAPRPALLIYNVKDDCCFEAHRARPSVFDPLIPFYRLFEAEADFEYHENILPGTHNYDLDNRQVFYDFLYRHFLPNHEVNLEELHSEEEIHTPEELYTGLPDKNANLQTLALEFLGSLPSPGLPKDAETLRRVLRAEPLEAEAQVVKREEADGVQASLYRIEVGQRWTIPAVVVSKEDFRETVIAISDGGRAGLSKMVHDHLSKGQRVVAVDPLFIGESIPGETKTWQYSQMIGTIGERPLGIQAEQIAAIARWVKGEFSEESVSVITDGWTAHVAALCAAALAPSAIKRVEAKNGLSSLKQLVEEHKDYADYPSLFCFGLLKHFDIKDLENLEKFRDRLRITPECRMDTPRGDL
jgi:hypothetical protein